MSPKTIDISTGTELFREADPVGLLYDQSAKSYMEELKDRVREHFPKARVFVRWSPTSADGADVYTIPRAEEAEARLLRMAKEVRRESDDWLQYDESVRAAFSM
ncbi:MAG: hypothetical protein ACFCGT_04985 [Sandaracinaceae bacterium]